MMRSLAWGGVILLPVVVLGGLWGARRDPTQPNWQLPTQMAASPAYRAQTGNPVLAGGGTLQPPVPGTLARGAHAFHYAPTDADRQRAGVELRNPVPATPRSLKEGKRLYDTFCATCHGATGNGDGPIIPKFPNPPSFHSEQSRKLRDGEVFHTITLGRKKMASYAAQLSREERWQVVRYIRSLQAARP
ncbi:MAG: cytochrome c [Armatimonadetes bacterium]|nr:cytochrome c [Armatimonadota bacterium]